MKTDSKAIVRLFIEEALNKGNLGMLDEIVHPDYIYNSPTERMEGIEDLKAFVQALRSAFPDLRIKISEQIAEDLKVCTRVSMSGTHNGDFLGTPATGKAVMIQGVIISRLEDGLIKEEWELLDQLALLHQLGIAENENV